MTLQSIGLGSAGGLTIITTIGAIIKSKINAAQAEAAQKERDKQQLLQMLSGQNAQTLAIVREELQSNRETTARFFDLMDRNTTALEKLVVAQASQSSQLEALRAELATVKGAVMARPA